MRLNNRFVSHMNEGASFIQRLAEEVHDAGGNLEELIGLFNSSDSIPRHQVANALLDLAVTPFSPHPFRQTMSAEKELPSFPDCQEGIVYNREWQSVNGQPHRETGLFQLFHPRFGMSVDQAHRFICKHGYNPATVQELNSIPENILVKISQQTLSEHCIWAVCNGSGDKKVPSVQLYCKTDGRNQLNLRMRFETDNSVDIRPYEYFLVRIPGPE